MTNQTPVYIVRDENPCPTFPGTSWAVEQIKKNEARCRGLMSLGWCESEFYVEIKHGSWLAVQDKGVSKGQAPELQPGRVELDVSLASTTGRVEAGFPEPGVGLGWDGRVEVRSSHEALRGPQMAHINHHPSRTQNYHQQTGKSHRHTSIALQSTNSTVLLANAIHISHEEFFLVDVSGLLLLMCDGRIVNANESKRTSRIQIRAL